MTAGLVTDEAVEAAAIARWDFVRAGIPDDMTWDMRQPHARRFDTDCMRAALTAAAPLIVDERIAEAELDRDHARVAGQKFKKKYNDLRAGIEALRDEIAAASPRYAVVVDRLDALLRGAK